MEFVNEMHVLKRDNTLELVSFDKILCRIKKLITNEKHINVTDVSMKIISQLTDGISTTKIDELTAQYCNSKSTEHYDYASLASKILVSNLHKNTSSSFAFAMKELYDTYDCNNNHAPLISKLTYDISQKYANEIDGKIVHERDNLIDYFGFKTLEKSYLFRKNNKVIERPQFMYMRVSIGIHGDNLEKIFETYDLMSQKYFIHATPTLFNSGTNHSQNSSCYLIAMKDDSIDGIYDTLKECALISKYAGGIGLHVHNIRGKHSHINGTNGKSNGLVPMLRVFNGTARYVDQGGGKRKGSIAIYIEPWHCDIHDILEIKKNHGDNELRCRDLFFGLWIPNLFMKRVENNENWSLFCPNECKYLSDVYGDEFDALYEYYERENKARETVNARDLWMKILVSQIETGGPYLLYKDQCNNKSNQKNIGTIKSSNLCTEIIEYSSDTETAVCNLASIGLTKYVEYHVPSDFIDQKIIMYSKTTCPYCNLAKALFAQFNVSYELITLDDDAERLDMYKTLSTTYDKLINTVPQIVVNEKLLGGWNDLRQTLKPTFNYQKLCEVTKVITYNLNQIIDVNFYPTQNTSNSNRRHRPIGIGVQGLADVFCMMDMSFESDEAKELNKNIFESIYYSALNASMEIAQEREQKMLQVIKFCDKYKINVDSIFRMNLLYADDAIKNTNANNAIRYDTESEFTAPMLLNADEYQTFKKMVNDLRPLKEEFDSDFKGAYSSFAGSPASQGILQYDMWNVQPSLRYDWDELKANIKKYGLRNSLLVAPMPTASTSQILGNNECFEPFTSNIYKRSTLAGEFMVVNKYLMRELITMGHWNNRVKDSIIENNGSVQHLTKLMPEYMRDKYKIVWEMAMKNIIDMSRDRGAFICQSQSLNLWQQNPNIATLTKMHFYAFKAGLKTGMYYLRTKAQYKAQQFTITPPTFNLVKSSLHDKGENEEVCESCSG